METGQLLFEKYEEIPFDKNIKPENENDYGQLIPTKAEGREAVKILYDTLYCRDDSTKSFMNVDAFLNFLVERETNSRWETAKTSRLKLSSVLNVTGALCDPTFNGIPDFGNGTFNGHADLINDTFSNSKLAIDMDGEILPLRDCAMKTVLDRARIFGHGLNKVCRDDFASIVNKCLTVASGKALIRISEGKVSAVHGGDPKDYSVIPMPTIFDEANIYINDHFRNNTFISAYWDHSIASAEWELSGSTELVKVYTQALERHNYPAVDIFPALRITSSDVGVSGANIFPKLFYGKDGRTIPLNSPLRLEHKNMANIIKFRENLTMIFAQYQSSLKRLTDLINIPIQNPGNCLMGAMKKLGLSKVNSLTALDMFKAKQGDEPCTAHELYYGLGEVIRVYQSDGANEGLLIRIEEAIARAISLNWKEFDYPGDIKW